MIGEVGQLNGGEMWAIEGTSEQRLFSVVRRGTFWEIFLVARVICPTINNIRALGGPCPGAQPFLAGDFVADPRVTPA